MIVLPERTAISGGKVLWPVPPREWRTPSQRKTVFGIEDNTRFRLTARRRDGHVVWRGWFDDHDDADAFLFAMARGTLGVERELWRLPSPEWHPGIGDHLSYDFATLTFLTSPTGSNQTFTSPSNWNNSNNTIETLGGGGSGGNSAGSGGAAYSLISNFSFANPGTTTATYQIGAGSAGSAAGSGAAGGDSWFNATTLAGSSVGSKGGGANSSSTGGTGGASASGTGTTKFSGGNGGTRTAGQGTGGGGGAAGKSGAGGTSSNPSSTSGTAGGTADNGTVSGGAISTIGNSGTEWDGTHGSGSGGGGTTTSSNVAGGFGGTYGGGGGGGDPVLNTTGGDGIQGIIVLTYTPLGGNLFPVAFLH